QAELALLRPQGDARWQGAIRARLGGVSRDRRGAWERLCRGGDGSRHGRDVRELHRELTPGRVELRDGLDEAHPGDFRSIRRRRDLEEEGLDLPLLRATLPPDTPPATALSMLGALVAGGGAAAELQRLDGAARRSEPQGAAEPREEQPAAPAGQAPGRASLHH